MKICGVFLFAIILTFFLSFSQVNAIQTFYGGFANTDGALERILDTNISIFWSQGDFFHYPFEADILHELADNGVKINFRICWWSPFFNGEIETNTTIIDLYYNATILQEVKDYFDLQFTYLNPDKVWALTIDEEVPRGAYQYFWDPENIEEYNQTYHSETGLWIRKFSGNITDEIVFNEWRNEKLIWVYNQLFDYVKSKWPHLQVFQFISMSPGAPPVFGSEIDLSDLKSDAYMGDLYFYEVYDNPLWLYEYIRLFKSTFPEKEYHIHLWGEEAWPWSAGGFEHIRRNAWIAYLAGIDALGWFNWHYELGDIWDRDDVLGKRIFLYTTRINHELAKAPLMKVNSQVLAIQEHMNYQLGGVMELGIFNEWDVVNQHAIMNNQLDLSQYKVIIASEKEYYDEAVDRLNNYVKSGGNLILLGGFGLEQKNLYRNASRKTLFLNEMEVTQQLYVDHVKINVSKPNPLNLTLQYDSLVFDAVTLLNSSLTDNHLPIGNFHFVEENGTLTLLDSSPLVLYHNASNPKEGWVLYWGLLKSTSTPESEYEDISQTFIPEWNYTRYLHREVSRAFMKNFLKLNSSVSTRETENMIITQTMMDDGNILAGISNYNPDTVDFNYTLDLKLFNLSDGEYCVHSLDEDAYLGSFESQQLLLEVPINVVPNGTKLLLISREKLNPNYAIEVFPEIPTEEDVKDLWSTENSSSQTSTTTSSTSINTESTSDWISFTVISALVVGGLVVIRRRLIFKCRERRLD